MKKIFVFVSAAIISMGIACAQDFEKATNLAKEGNEALTSGDFTKAIESFKAAAVEAEQCTEEGVADLVANCKKGFVMAQNAYSQALYKAGQLEDAVAQAVETIKVAAENGEEEIGQKAAAFKLQLHQAIANAKMKAAGSAADAAEKAVAYKAALENLKEVIAATPDNAKAYLQQGQIYNALGQKEAAIDSYVKAKELGAEEQANKQLSNIYLKEAQAFSKAQKYNDAIASALKSAEYQANGNAYKIAGISAGKANDFKGAVEYLEKYLELTPNAKDAEQMKAAIAAYKAQLNK